MIKEEGKIRKARLKDAHEIQKLINFYAQKGEMLPRSLSEIYETVREFTVWVDGEGIWGVCALHICWEDLAEIRSLAVKPEYCHKGIGTALSIQCIKEAEELEISKLFALTYKPDFFEKLGFKRVDKSQLPHKVWRDCLHCIKFPDCDEVALLRTRTS